MGLLGLSAFLAVIVALYAPAGRVYRRVRVAGDLEPIWWDCTPPCLRAGRRRVRPLFFHLDFHALVAFFWLYLGLAAATTDTCKT